MFLYSIYNILITLYDHFEEFEEKISDPINIYTIFGKIQYYSMSKGKKKVARSILSVNIAIPIVVCQTCTVLNLTPSVGKQDKQQRIVLKHPFSGSVLK